MKRYLGGVVLMVALAGCGTAAAQGPGTPPNDPCYPGSTLPQCTPLTSPAPVQDAVQNLDISATWTGSECDVTATNPGTSVVTVAYVTVANLDSSGNQISTVHVPLPVSGIGPGNTVTAAESKYVVDSWTAGCQAVGWSSGY